LPTCTAQVDNLLTVLSQNAFLDAIEEGSAALVILGDAVHCEAGRATAGDGEFDAADGSHLSPQAAVSAAGVLSFAATMIPSPKDIVQGRHSAGVAVGQGTQPSSAVPAYLQSHGRVLPAVALRRFFRRFRRLPRGGAAQAEVSKDDAGEHPPPPRS
jgi:hypothetical protein